LNYFRSQFGHYIVNNYFSLKLVIIQRFYCIVLRLYKLDTSLISIDKVSDTIRVRHGYVTQVGVSVHHRRSWTVTVSLRYFFEFFLNFLFFKFFLNFFLNVHVSTQQCAMCQSQCSIFNLVPIFVIFVQFSPNFC